MPAYGQAFPDWLDRAVIGVTSHLPNNWLGLRIAIGLRRVVTRRLHDDNGFDVVRWGLRLRLHPRRNGCEKGLLFTPQMFEVPEQAELLKEIDTAKAEARPFRFVDIGANVGLFSMLVAAYAGSSADIIAFEPEEENLKRLRFNVASNPGINVRIMPFALGAVSGSVILEIDPRDRGGTRVRRTATAGQNAVIPVECRTLTEVLKEQNFTSVDAMKIDVEGSEDEILTAFFQQADQTLWPRLLIIEDTRDDWSGDLFSVLARCGYTVSSTSKLNVMLRKIPN